MKTTGGEREVLKLILFLKDQSFSVMGVAYLIKKGSDYFILMFTHYKMTTDNREITWNGKTQLQKLKNPIWKKNLKFETYNRLHGL